MKRIKKYLSIYLSIFIFIISVFNLSANAANSGGGGYFTEDSFSFSATTVTIGNYTGGYYYMEDDSNLPDSFMFYYKIADGKAECCLTSDIITTLLNKKIGVSLSSQYLNLLIQNLDSFWKGTGITNVLNLSEFLDQFKPVYKGNSMVGISLSNLTGCRLVYSLPEDKITIPSGVTNNVYNYFTDVFLIDYPDTIDYFNLGTLSNSDCKNYLSTGQTNYQNILNKLNSNNTFLFYFNPSSGSFNYGQGNNYCVYSDSLADCTYCASATERFDEVVMTFNLSSTNIAITSSDLLTNSANLQLLLKIYDKNSNQVNLEYKYSNGGNTSTNNYVLNSPVLFNGQTGRYIVSPNGEYITVYRNQNIITQVTNNTYKKNYYTSTITNNYNTNNDNSYTTNVQTVNNSSSNNTNIYNQQSTSNNSSIVDNDYTYDYSQNNSNNTTIINNYYGDSSDDDDPGDDDDDDTIWDALLKAIAEFFKKIGEFLAAILTGIVELFTEIVGAITNITTNLTGLTDFLASIFSWLPTEIVSIITLGFALGVFICLIKLFK